MKLKIGDLVSVDKSDKTIGVIVSSPIETPTGYTVRVAFNDKVMAMYTWCLKPVSIRQGENKHFRH